MSWDCPNCNYNNSDGWHECGYCYTNKPYKPMLNRELILLKIKELRYLSDNLASPEKISEKILYYLSL